MDNFLDHRDIELLTGLLPSLPAGFKAHAQALIDGRDPTGGMVALHDQLNMLVNQSNK